MAICKGLKPGDGRRLQAHAQRCGALPEPGEEFCAVHLKAAGRRRCASCGAWTGSGVKASAWVQICPNGCAQPAKADEHAQILAEMQALNKQEG